MEAKLIALVSASEETNWLRDLLYKIPLWEKPIPTILIHCDNTATIGRIKNRYYNSKSKPIRRKNRTVRSYLSSGIITMDYIKSNDNLTNPFTKALAKDRVYNTSRGMGIKPEIHKPCMRIPNPRTRNPENWVQWEKRTIR